MNWKEEIIRKKVSPLMKKYGFRGKKERIEHAVAWVYRQKVGSYEHELMIDDNGEWYGLRLYFTVYGENMERKIFRDIPSIEQYHLLRDFYHYKNPEEFSEIIDAFCELLAKEDQINMIYHELEKLEQIKLPKKADYEKLSQLGSEVSEEFWKGYENASAEERFRIFWERLELLRGRKLEDTRLERIQFGKIYGDMILENFGGCWDWKYGRYIVRNMDDTTYELPLYVIWSFCMMSEPLDYTYEQFKTQYANYEQKGKESL